MATKQKILIVDETTTLQSWLLSISQKNALRLRS